MKLQAGDLVEVVVERADDGMTHHSVGVYLYSVRVALGKHTVHVQDLDGGIHRASGHQVAVGAERTGVTLVLMGLGGGDKRLEIGFGTFYSQSPPGLEQGSHHPMQE